MEIFDFFRSDRWPHMFCPGCGNGVVMNCLYNAFSEAELDLDRTVFISGIGCSSRIPGYIFADSLHTTHGRAIPYATGIKLGNPGLNVIVITGDGDLGAIGGNHFINACRRNMDLTVICVNNNIYGMTGGQESTTTPHGFLTTTTPGGKVGYPFDLAALASTAGANFVARWTVSHVKQLAKSIKLALEKEGFSFVETVSSCPIHFGRMNRMGDTRVLYRWLRENSIPLESLGDIDDPLSSVNPLDLNIEGKITTGIFRDASRKSFLELFEELR
ncbi:MAG: thiamine pyrophosphate-dependent enzyme [Halobacteriota archaeon]|nr:thiamine pyrophosphate-dependent enzyme [Halobacteriota archaeon]